MLPDKIRIIGAREHNLKNISLELPRDKLIVITGISGSGKSSLAFDTIYAEGQRRYVESLSAYARQFLGQLDKPDVDYIDGLSPAISIEQRSISKNPRSTVGTVTEIYDYLRLLFARIGKPYCYRCQNPIKRQTPQEITDQLEKLPSGTKLEILAPLVRSKKGEHQQIFDYARKQGFLRVRVDGVLFDLGEEILLDKNKKHNIEVVVDRILLKKGVRTRLAQAVETAGELSGSLVMAIVDEEKELLFSQELACVSCGVSYPALEPRAFSFNSPYGACPNCSGLGSKMELDADLIIPDKERSIMQAAIKPWGIPSGKLLSMLEAVAKHYNFSLNTPFYKLTEEQQRCLLYGSKGEIIQFFSESWGSYYGSFEGVIPNLQRRYQQTDSEYVKTQIEEYMTSRICPQCQGTRLKKESLAVKINNMNIAEISDLSVKAALNLFQNLELPERDALIAQDILKEITRRLKFLVNVGMDYITISRSAGSLAGGEAQRIHLATQIGSGLVGVLYILDEPSIGLHPRDNDKLLNTLEELRDIGNTVIVVEHDEATIRRADYIVDLGPGAGDKGGYLVVAGTLSDVISSPQSITGAYLSGRRKIPIPHKRKKGSGKYLEIGGARKYNLKNITVRIPLGLFVCITGVSGSGKSTLISEVLYPALCTALYSGISWWRREKPEFYDYIKGAEYINRVINIDQSPIGRTPRSNPATYTGVFNHIRDLFASLVEAKLRCYKPGRFSFNVKGGRCEACEGNGMIKIEMQFLPDVYIPCEVCKGKRYNKETLEVKYKGKNIADILDLPVEEGLKLFSSIPQIARKLQLLCDVGLGYMKLGQPAPSLSGGEAQRVKLAAELGKKSTGNTLYLLDEPTVGSHFADIDNLLKVLLRLRDAGNTIVVIEHNLDIIKTADYIIDLGPEGGEKGGYVIACGTPEEIAESEVSYTGKFLQPILGIEKKGAKRDAA